MDQMVDFPFLSMSYLSTESTIQPTNNHINANFHVYIFWKLITFLVFMAEVIQNGKRKPNSMLVHCQKNNLQLGKQLGNGFIFQLRQTIASTLRQAVLLILDEIKYFFWSIPAISTMIAMAIIKDFKPSFTKFKCIVFNQYFNAQIFLQSTGSVESFMIIPTVPSGILWKSLIWRPCNARVTMINVIPHMDYTSRQPQQHWFLHLLLSCYLAYSDLKMGFI